MGIYLSDHDHDCLTNLRFADDVLLFASSKEQLQKMMCDFKKSTEKVGLGIHPEKTNILSNQSSLNSDTKKGTRRYQNRNPDRRRKREILGPDDYVPATRDDRNQNRIRAAWATFHKYRQELTSKNHMLKHRLRLFDAAITPTICYASGTLAPTKEHERMIQSTQRKMLRLIIQTQRRYKMIEKREDKISEEFDNIDSSCTDDGDGQSSVSHIDQDSDVSFESDNDEEIDAAEIEEDWVEYIERSTNDAMEKMENEKIRCWNKTHKK